MSSIWIAFSQVSMLTLGIIVALVGVAKPEISFADGIEDKDSYFGNKESPVDVYVITDWFCPLCYKIEPKLEEMYPQIMSKARLFFIDKEIHPETMNYVPYNLSLMINEKKKYIEARRALHELALKKKSPSVEDVQAVLKPLGIKYQQLSYSDIENGVHFFEGIIKTFKVNATPTLIITNRHKLESKKLVGSEITESNVKKALDEMMQSK